MECLLSSGKDAKVPISRAARNLESWLDCPSRDAAAAAAERGG